MNDNIFDEKQHALLEEMASQFISVIPFATNLGMQLKEITPNTASITLPMQKEFIGNPFQGTLHGGVIATLLDHVGGMVTLANMLGKLSSLSRQEQLDRIAKVGTIDLRIDYLRPGIGKEFTASANILRAGNKVTVIHAELCNQEDILLATGTGTYLVG